MPERMKPYVLSALLVLSVLYLGVQALTGQYGLLTGDERAATLAKREATYLRLTEERQDLELRVRYLQTDHLSRDLLEERARVLLGVGLNVAQDAFPPPLDGTATSLLLATGQPVPRLAPLEPLLVRLGDMLGQAEADPDALVAAVEARMEGGGGRVAVRDPSSGRVVAEGRVLGLAPGGALRLATEAGEVEVVAGEVTLATP